MLATPLQAQLIAEYDRANNAGCNTTTWATTNLSVTGLCRGSGIAYNTGGDYNSRNWATGASLDATDYIELVATPDAGYQLDISSMKFRLDRSNSGPPNYVIRSSVDGYTSDLATGTISASGSTITDVFSLSSTSAITIRIYCYGASSSAGTMDVEGFTGTNVGDAGAQLFGTVTATCSAPSTQASSFTSSGISFTNGTTQWTRGNGDNVLVVASTSSTPTDPSSGTAYTANTAYGSGDAVGSGYVVYNGTGTSVNVTGLASGTTYYFYIYEYFNTGTCYHLTELTGNFTTLTTSSSSDIIAVASSESATIPSTTTTAGPLTSTQGVQVWQFTIRDGGGSTDSDAFGTVLESVSLTQGAGNAMDNWSDAIQSADLFDGSTHLATGTIGASQIDFTGFSATAPDNGSKTLSVRISLNCGVGTGNGNNDGDDFQFSILNSDATVAASNSSGFSAFTTASSNNGDNVYAVTATELQFDNQASSTGINNAMSTVTVNATDACGNIDTDYTGTVTITSTGTLSGSSTNTAALSSGTATFTNIIHSATGTSLTLTASVSGLTNATSTTFDIVLSTSFEKGDFAIIAVNTTRNASGSADEVCFITFKNITAGTSFEITDNGYERVTAGQWGNTEGTVKFTRDASATTISAGSIICIEGPDASYDGDGVDKFDIYVCGVKDDANWTLASQTNYNPQQMDWNSSDQVWIMQGGTWNHNTDNGHDDTYTGGNVLYGWTAIPWETSPGYSSTAGSTLFNGMDCYVTNVTGVTNKDKVKYTGSKTGTKLELLALINDNANWTGYADNASYDAAPAAYDYLNESCTNTGFTINTATASPGIWTGDIDDDWFFCGNWENFEIPTSTTDVTIDQDANNDCLVSGDDAECQSLSISSNSNTNNNLEVDGTGSLTIGNALSITKSAGTGNLTVETTGATTFQANDVTITGTAASANNAEFRNESSTSTVEFTGDLTINNGGYLDLDGTADGTLSIGGHYTNNHNAAGFEEGGSTIIFNGSANQNITTNSFTESFNNVTLSKSAGALVLQNNISLLTTATLSLFDDQVDLNGNQLTLNNPATGAITRTSGSIVEESGAASGNNSGKINWVMGTTTGSHVFPFASAIGGTYIPFTFNLNSGNAGTVSLSTYGTPATNLPWPSSPTNVSNLYSSVGLSPDNRAATADRFWQIDETGGSANADITFSYLTSELPASPYNDHTQMMAQRWDASSSSWDETVIAGQTRGTITGGYYLTAPGITSFSPWTLGHLSSPLPVELLEFNAESNKNVVNLNWATASEKNTDYFLVERSKDGESFETVSYVKASGNSINTLEYYSTDFKPIGGQSYYRLKMVDYDGFYEYSQLVPVTIDNNTNTLSAGRIQNGWNVFYSTQSEDAMLELLNSMGQIIKVIPLNKGNDQNTSLIPDQISNGVYFLRLIDRSKEEIVKVVY